ncbi:hypothetical protein BDW62DRAFT_136818 [Aspergillus aurantiobrunneus]
MRALSVILFPMFFNTLLRKRFLYPWLSGQIRFIFFFSPGLSKIFSAFSNGEVQFYEWPMVWGVVYPASNYRLGHVLVCLRFWFLSFFFFQRDKRISLAEGFLDSDPHICCPLKSKSRGARDG